MAFSAGVYTLPTPALVPGQIVSSSENNTVRNDMAASFNLTMLRNGTSTATANLPMGGFKLTGLGAPTTNGDALSYGAAAVVSNLTDSALTSGRVPYASTGGLLVDASGFTFDGTKLTVAGFKDSALTSGRVVYSTTSGELTDNSVFTFDGTTLSSTKFAGALNGTVGATTPAAGTFTSLSDSGNLTFTGTGNRITGDFSNATVANRVAFQTSASNNSTIVSSVPNGTSLISGFGAYSSADPTNSSSISMVIRGDASDARFTSGQTGTGTYLPMTFYTGGSERMRIDTSGNVGIGTSSPGVKLDVNGGIRSQGWGGNSSAGNYLFGAGATPAQIYGDSSLMAMYTNSSERMRIDSSGNLLVGTTSTSVGEKVRIVGNDNVLVTQCGNGLHGLVTTNGSGTGNYYAAIFCNNGTSFSGRGDITVGASTVSYNSYSDYRLKESIEPMIGALDKVAQLNPVTYTWKDTKADGQGFIAHELQAIVPDCVTGEKDAVDVEGKPVYQGIDTSFLVATLTKAIQELSAQTTALKAELDATKAEVAVLKTAA